MVRKSVIWIGLLAFIYLIVIAVEDAGAIPAFARRYKISCSTCHAPFPKLKAYGEDYAGDGFILKEEEKERDYVTAGDNLMWLNREFPLAVRLDAYALYDQDQKVNKDLQIPWGLKFMSGGTLFKNIGYYFYFYMSERGEVAGIEDGYIHFNNIFGSNLDVMVGQFQTSDPLMKRELRLTFEDYIIYKLKVGASRTNLTYDRGVMLVYDIPQTGTSLVGLLVNGNGKGVADEQTKKFDDDKFKNFGIRALQDIGEVASVGVFYYQGKEQTLYEESLYPNQTNKVTYWGPDFNASAGPVELTAQYLVRKDTNPYFQLQSRAKDTEGKGWVIEVILAPQLDRSRFYLTALYNQIDHDYNSLDYESMTLSGTYLLARNLRLMAEYTRDLISDKNRLSIGMVTGF